MRQRPISALEPARQNGGDLKRIAHCHTVISVDTAVAHLSAGSKRPTKLPLGDPPDWRWRPVPRILKPRFGILTGR